MPVLAPPLESLLPPGTDARPTRQPRVVEIIGLTATADANYAEEPPTVKTTYRAIDDYLAKSLEDQALARQEEPNTLNFLNSFWYQSLEYREKKARNLVTLGIIVQKKSEDPNAGGLSEDKTYLDFFHEIVGAIEDVKNGNYVDKDHAGFDETRFRPLIRRAGIADKDEGAYITCLKVYRE